VRCLVLTLLFTGLVVACEPSSSGPTPTLTPVTLPAEIVAVKSWGRILRVNGSVLVIQVDRGNGGATRVLDGAVIALRTGPETSVQRVEIRSDPNVTLVSLADIASGETVTFMFELKSFDPSDGSYFARVIGRP